MLTTFVSIAGARNNADFDDDEEVEEVDGILPPAPFDVDDGENATTALLLPARNEEETTTARKRRPPKDTRRVKEAVTVIVLFMHK